MAWSRTGHGIFAELELGAECVVLVAYLACFIIVYLTIADHDAIGLPDLLYVGVRCALDHLPSLAPSQAYKQP